MLQLRYAIAQYQKIHLIASIFKNPDVKVQKSLCLHLIQIKHLTMLNPRISVCNQHNDNSAEQTLARDYPHGINSSALTDFLLIKFGFNKTCYVFSFS